MSAAATSPVGAGRGGGHTPARGPSRPYKADPGWGGELISSWAITPDGELRWEAIADRGADARDAIDQAASELHARLHDRVIDR